LTVVTPPWGDEMSSPQLAQKCAPGGIAAPQRLQDTDELAATLKGPPKNP
jgi:hypothetical protein